MNKREKERKGKKKTKNENFGGKRRLDHKINKKRQNRTKRKRKERRKLEEMREKEVKNQIVNGGK